MSAPDQQLVDRCRQGDQDAFAEIVGRYQNLICSIAYSGTGSLAMSEELAQETFLSAWRSMSRLREPASLRPWLCGIVRNLARNATRSRRRDVLEKATPVDEQPIATGAGDDPVAATIAREEAALMQRTLQALPETYREPMILYYRESQSVAHVAELLDLSPDAVKQRLARGRKLLESGVAVVIERGLARSTPGRAFTIGVVTALPLMTGTAKAATLTATGAKGASAMQAAGTIGMLGVILGPLVGIAGAWLGVKMSLKAARSKRERAMIVRFTWWLMGLVVAFITLLTALIVWGLQLAEQSPVGFAVAMSTVVIGYVGTLLGMILWFNRRQAQIHREEGSTGATPEEVAAQMPAALRRWQYPAVYESRLRLLGLPLVSIRFDGVVGDPDERRAAVGWIAIGDKAVGVLFACGAIAVGGIACGAISFGVLSFGGLALGAVAVGGGALGWMAGGGMAVGVLAFGGCAMAWQAAMGGMAAAREFAVGGVAVAEHANDELARQVIADHRFFQVSEMMATHNWSVLVLVGVLLLPMLAGRWLAERAGRAVDRDATSQRS